MSVKNYVTSGKNARLFGREFVFQCAFEVLSDVFPVDNLEEVIDVLAAVVLVFEVVSVLPDVECEDGDSGELCLFVVVFRSKGNELVSAGLPAKESPTAGFDRFCSGSELCFEAVEAAKVFFDLLEQIAGGIDVLVGRAHVVPEHDVVEVTGTVECGQALKMLDLGEIAGFTGFFECFFGAVESVYVSEVVFVVMQTHGLLIDEGLKSVVCVGEFGKFVITGHGDSPIRK